MQQDANKTTGYVNEQDLQAVTGGCGGCAALSSFAQQQATQANLHSNLLSQIAPTTASAEQHRVAQLDQVAVEVQNSVRMSPLPGCEHCSEFPNVLKKMYPLVHFGKV